MMSATTLPLEINDRAMTVRALALYGPVMLALLLGLGRRREPRLLAAVLLGVLWTMPGLLILQHINLHAGWWTFETAGPAFRGMPVELYLGWCCLWGAVPALAFRRLPVAFAVAAMMILDVAVMPLCGPVVLLGRDWLAGEAVAALVVLLPGLLLARWTVEGRRLKVRAAFQVVIAGGIFLFLPPEIVFALRGGAWSDVALHGWRLGLALQAIAGLSLIGLSAVQEFASCGGGTPIPYDPPVRLVVTGVYRYIANPMQLSCTLVMLAWGLLFWNAWLVAGGAIALIYSAGVARWDEREDLRLRFGEPWVEYRRHLHDWRPRCKPFSPGPPARLFLATQCGVCSQLRLWFEAHNPVGLHLLAAEDHPTRTLRRMRYETASGDAGEDGVRAFARALEHLHPGWALLGMAIRLPILHLVIQTVADGVGFGERDPHAPADAAITSRQAVES